MDNSVIIALIGAGATIVAALVAAICQQRQHPRPDPTLAAGLAGDRWPSPGPRGERPRRWWPAATVVAGVLLAAASAGIVLFWQTPHGTVRIESDDPSVEIVFDKNGPTIKGTDKEPITLRAGEHGLLVKRGDLSFETDKLLIKKGETITLKIELLGGKLRLVQDGKVIASRAGQGAQQTPAPSAPVVVAHDGFVPLINGRDVSGWRRQGTNATTWTVRDGSLFGRNTLRFGPKNGNTAATVGTLVTDRTDYSNFHLRGEFELRRGTFLQFRGPSDFQPGDKTAYRVPVDAPGSLWVFPGDHGKPTVFGPATNLHLKAGDWVRLEVIARGPLIQVLNNGTMVVEYAGAQKLLPSGPISLTCTRATTLQVRNLEIKELRP